MSSSLGQTVNKAGGQVPSVEPLCTVGGLSPTWGAEGGSGVALLADRLLLPETQVGTFSQQLGPFCPGGAGASCRWQQCADPKSIQSQSWLPGWPEASPVRTLWSGTCSFPIAIRFCFSCPVSQQVVSQRQVKWQQAVVCSHGLCSLEHWPAKGYFNSLTVSSVVPPQPFQVVCGLPPGSVIQGAGWQSLCLPVGFDVLTHLALVSSVSL